MSLRRGMMAGAAGAPPVGTLHDEIMADAPFAYWELGETAGPTSFLDQSGNGYHLTVIAAGVTAGTTGLVAGGTCVDFDGATGVIRSGNNEFGAAVAAAFTGDVPFTIMSVVNIDGTGCLLHVGNVGVAGSQGLFCEVRSGGSIRVQHITGGGYKFVDSSAAVLPAATTKIVHVRRTVPGTGSVGAVFVNGVNVTSGATDLSGSIAIAASSSNGGNRFAIGALQASTPSGYFNGRQQHVALFTTALSSARMLVHKAAAGL